MPLVFYMLRGIFHAHPACTFSGGSPFRHTKPAVRLASALPSTHKCMHAGLGLG